jgi:molybdopterin-containing oxidoreductase family iron-sulfur binding subunit
MSANPDTGRRQALKLALTAAALAVHPGLLLYSPPARARAPGVAASAAQRWGLLIDASRCAGGCTRCVDACAADHGWTAGGPPGRAPQWIRTITAADPETGRASQLPLMCQHCARPPCADVCPTSATFRRADGVVLVDRHRCIGCRYCVMACPFGARFFLGEDVDNQPPHSPRGKGTAEGCTLCVHRIDEGRLPVCVEACPAGAMTFGDLNDPRSPLREALANSSATRLRADLALGQSVQYRGL